MLFQLFLCIAILLGLFSSPKKLIKQLRDEEN